MARNYQWKRIEDDPSQQDNNSSESHSNPHLHVPKSVNLPLSNLCFDRRDTPPVPFADALASMRNAFVLTEGLKQSSNVLPQRLTWLQQFNNSSGEASSRKAAAKDLSKKEIDNWVFLYFRIRVDNYMNIVSQSRTFKASTLFSDDVLDKWTYKMRFRMKRDSPMKYALTAFSSRFGLSDDTNLVFCLDGFFGDIYCGRIGNPNSVPVQVVSSTVTPVACGLRNGSSIFVSRADRTVRELAFNQMKSEFAEHESASSNAESVKLVGSPLSC